MTEELFQRLNRFFKPQEVDAMIEWADNKAHSILDLSSVNYPQQLANIVRPPKFLFVKGQVASLFQPQIAMVGSRYPTPTGLDTAYAFARDLTEQGYVITSGLALGIDAMSHRGALDAAGQTIAVLGSGIENIYPKQHLRLAAEIAEQGAVISEFPIYAAPKAHHFPIRNRIISGLSLGVLVAEAKLKSGSLITTRYALEQGREVFAIPGSIHNPMAKGCHHLLRQGACLVQTTADILQELPPAPVEAKLGKKSIPDICCLDKDKQKLVKCVGYEATSVDILIKRSEFPAHLVNSLLVELELAGFIHTVPGGYMRNSS